MSDDDEIRAELQKAGIDQPTELDLDAVRRFCTMGLFSLPIAAEIVATGGPPTELPQRRPWRGPIRRFLDALDREQRERQRYLSASPEIRDAYLAGHAAGLRDASLLRP